MSDNWLCRHGKVPDECRQCEELAAKDAEIGRLRAEVRSLMTQRAMLEDLIAAERQRARMPEWVSTADRLPESGQIVLAYHLNQLGKPRRIRAAYIKAMTQEASPESDLDCDYDEATDTFYWPEGWYEQMEHWEEYTAVILAEDIKVTHWMPLPDPPAGGQSDEI